jgi:hypothetical protein
MLKLNKYCSLFVIVLLFTAPTSLSIRVSNIYSCGIATCKAKTEELKAKSENRNVEDVKNDFLFAF